MGTLPNAIASIHVTGSDSKSDGCIYKSEYPIISYSSLFEYQLNIGGFVSLNDFFLKAFSSGPSPAAINCITFSYFDFTIASIIISCFFSFTYFPTVVITYLSENLFGLFNFRYFNSSLTPLDIS